MPRNAQTWNKNKKRKPNIKEKKRGKKTIVTVRLVEEFGVR